MKIRHIQRRALNSCVWPWEFSKSMLARFFLTLAFCIWALHAYPKDSTQVSPEQDYSQPCFPPDAYISHPGDPPFGVHVQATTKFNEKRYLLGIEYCEDGTFEFSGSNQGIVSLNGTFYRTGRWWWEGDKSCTQIDAVATDTEIPPVQCKEAGHWLGDHIVPIPHKVRHGVSGFTPG